MKMMMKTKSKSKNLNKILLTLPFALTISTAVFADQVILDDLIVDGSICAGMDCVNGESFGFDTLRLKENNLRIKFDDTSNSASFPSNDWQITANDSSNGGANKFSIDDITAGRTPFTIEASAPAHSLYVDDGGRIGLGTSTPVVDVHVKSGNTPTLRLEQDGSSGFGPQTWDVAGNETNFFVRDASNGSTLPFRIFPGAPSDSISIAADGDVGIGTTSPVGRFDVKSSDNSKTLLSITDSGKLAINSNNSGEFFEVEANINLTSAPSEHVMIGLNTTDENYTGTLAFQTNGTDLWMLSSRNKNTWPSGSSADRLSFFNGSASEVLTIHQNGSLFIGDNGSNINNNTNNAIDTVSGAHLTAGGVWTNASSRDLKEKIVSLSGNVAMKTLKSLTPVTYMYKAEPGETYVGFIAEDVPSVVAANDRKSLASMDIVAVLTKVLQMQDREIEKLNSRLDNLEK